MQVTYDLRTDTLTIILSDVPISESDEEKGGLIIDYDAEGNLVSMDGPCHMTVHEFGKMTYRTAIRQEVV